MNNLTCPACGEPMETQKAPDLALDVCGNCGGRFLDKGELNALATGMAGDIEMCSIDNEPHESDFPTRRCPKCPDTDMRKVNLLALSDIIFDWCPNCGGFFLDGGETAQSNLELAQLAGAPVGEEFRGTVQDHLVRVDKIHDVHIYASGLMGDVRGTPVDSVKIAVFFKEPLGRGLRLSKERWPVKLAKAFGLYGGQDIETGNREFDAAFIVQGDSGVERLLTEEAASAILDFHKRRPKIFAEPGTLAIHDDRIEYTEGPYTTVPVGDLHKAAGGIIEGLLKIAAAMESGTQRAS